MYRSLLLERRVSSNKTSCHASFSSEIKKMSQKQSQKAVNLQKAENLLRIADNLQKAVLTQIQNQVSKPIIVSSQGEVKSQIQAASQDRVPSQDRGSQASSYVASQGQVQLQLASFRLKSLRLESQVLRLKSQTQVSDSSSQTQGSIQVRNEEDEMRFWCFQ